MLRKQLRWLSSLRVVGSVARGLGIAPMLRRAYHGMAASNDIFTAQLADVSIALYAKTGKELLSLEGALVTERGWSERPHLEAFIAFLRPGDVAWEVGANSGLYSVTLGKRVGEKGSVIAFETVSSNFARLKANAEFNHLPNVTCFQLALGEQDAKVDIHTDPENPWCSTIMERPDAEPGQQFKIESVNVVNGDAFRNKQGLPIPRAVKIDVEGFEPAVMC